MMHEAELAGSVIEQGIEICLDVPVLDAIHAYLGQEIRVMEIKKDDYRETIGFSEDTPNDNWKSLLEEHEKALSKKKKKK